MFVEISTVVYINFNHSSLNLRLIFFYLSLISTSINLEEYTIMYFNPSVLFYTYLSLQQFHKC